MISDLIARAVQEELDRREAEAQSLCLHNRDGTLLANGKASCDSCGKPMGQHEVDNAYGDYDPPPSLVEKRLVGSGG